MTFFQKNPQRFKQYTYPRRGGGYTAPQITLHTYEAPHNRSLLAAATWLTQRTTPGSYHALAGAKSETDVLQLAPWSYETWHSVPSNNWSIGISAVAYAHEWNQLHPVTRTNLVRSMAFAAANAAKWLQVVHGRKVEPRLLTLAQAMRKESGFVYHAVVDPDRRSDPGKHFPWNEFIAHFNRLMSDKKEDEFDMATLNDLRTIVREELTKMLPDIGEIARHYIWHEQTVTRGGQPVLALQDVVDGTSAAFRTERKVDQLLNPVLISSWRADEDDEEDEDEEDDEEVLEPEEPVPVGDGTLILARPSATLTSLQIASTKLGGSELFTYTIIPALYTAAIAYGIDPTVMVAQSAHETGWGRFGRAVTPEHHNPCGLKVRDISGRADDDPDAHARFSSWQEGAEAHASHLRAYTSTPIEPPLVDRSPRSSWVWPREWHAETVRDLSGRWAPSPTYGDAVAAVAARLLD